MIEAAGEPEAFVEALRMVRKVALLSKSVNWVDLAKTRGAGRDASYQFQEPAHPLGFSCGTNWRPVLKVWSSNQIVTTFHH